MACDNQFTKKTSSFHKSFVNCIPQTKISSFVSNPAQILWNCSWNWLHVCSAVCRACMWHPYLHRARLATNMQLACSIASHPMTEFKFLVLLVTCPISYSKSCLLWDVEHQDLNPVRKDGEGTVPMTTHMATPTNRHFRDNRTTVETSLLHQWLRIWRIRAKRADSSKRPLTIEA